MDQEAEENKAKKIREGKRRADKIKVGWGKHDQKTAELSFLMQYVQWTCHGFKRIEEALECEVHDPSGRLHYSRKDIEKEHSLLHSLIHRLLRPITSQKKDDCINAVLKALHTDAIVTNAQEALQSFTILYEQDFKVLEKLFYKNYDDRVIESKNFLSKQNQPAPQENQQ